MLPAQLALWVTGGLIAAVWLVTWAAGGSKTVAPHGFYLAIIFAATRFGARGALVAAVASGIVVGPLMPLDVDAGTVQQPVNWAMRLGAFVAVGQITAFLVGHSVSSVQGELERRRVRRELRQAVEHGQLSVEYQPIVDLTTGRIEGVEALVRWRHPTRGPVPPGVFVPAAERAGVAGVVTKYVLDESCRQVAQWRRGVLDRRERFRLAVNLSGSELHDPDLKGCVRGVLQRSGLPASWLHLEVTETALIRDLDAAIEGLVRLRHLGVRLAIDDFGAGESSLAYLHRFPVDVVKIDRSFIDRLVGDQRGMLIARSVVDLARAMSLRTVAEGVETSQQADALRAVGCEMAQGYLFSRPRSAGTIELLLAEDARSSCEHEDLPRSE